MDQECTLKFKMVVLMAFHQMNESDSPLYILRRTEINEFGVISNRVKNLTVFSKKISQTINER